MLLCPRRQSNQNAAGGRLREHLRAAGAHSHPPYPLWPFGPTPPDRGSWPPGPLFYGGRIPVFLGTFVRRAKSEWRLLLFPAHWGLVRSKFAECYILLHAASLGKARADGLLSRADETSAPTNRLPVLCVGAGVSPARRLLPRPHRNNAPPFKKIKKRARMFHTPDALLDVKSYPIKTIRMGMLIKLARVLRQAPVAAYCSSAPKAPDSTGT